MFNILIFYLFFMISVCFFFRKYCQDHSLVTDQLKQEKEEHDMRKKKQDEEVAAALQSEFIIPTQIPLRTMTGTSVYLKQV